MCTWSNKLDEKEEEEKKSPSFTDEIRLCESVFAWVRPALTGRLLAVKCQLPTPYDTLRRCYVCVHISVCVWLSVCVCVSALHSQECVRVTGRQTDGRRAKERQQGAGKSIDNVTSFIILHWHCDTLRCCVCLAGSLPSRVRVQKIQDVKSVP